METMTEKETMVNFSMWLTPRQLRKVLDVIDTPSSDEQEITAKQEKHETQSTDVETQMEPAKKQQEHPEMGYSSTGQLIPWDERIHTTNRSKTAGNKWRVKSKIDREEYLPSIEAEIWASMVGSADDHQVDLDTHAETKLHSAEEEEPPIDNKSCQVDIEDDLALFNISFSELVPYVSNAKRKQIITSEEIENSCRDLGIKNFGVLATSPSLIPKMIKNLKLSTFILQEKANAL